MWRNGSGLAGKSVVVTGAAGGIGRSVAAGFAESGSKVLAVDMPGTAIDEVVASFPGIGHQAMGIDLSDISRHGEIFRRANELAPLAALVHCAAVLRRRETVDEVTEEDWDLQIDVNLKATFFLNRMARDAFRMAGTHGSIVNFVSQAWWSGGFGGAVVYAASKGGVVSMSRGLARSFAVDNVRVNCIAPGGVDTAMMENQTPEQLAAFISMTPLRRLARPDEMVGGALFLCSDASTFVTGVTLNISGGQLMY
jgi:NAD(P)-dependent dehydrogenase (short-subunit alcohol dehydrogenase family)